MKIGPLAAGNSPECGENRLGYLKTSEFSPKKYNKNIFSTYPFYFQYVINVYFSGISPFPAEKAMFFTYF